MCCPHKKAKVIRCYDHDANLFDHTCTEEAEREANVKDVCGSLTESLVHVYLCFECGFFWVVFIFLRGGELREGGMW